VRISSPDRIFLANHMLRDVVGHHLGYNLALADAAVRAGVAPRLVAHRKFPLSLAAGNPCERIFHTDFRAAPAPWIAANHWLLALLEKWCDRQFGADLTKFPEVGKSDTIFAQMLAPRHFRRWLDWIAARLSPPVLFLHLGYRPGRFATPEVAGAIGRLRPETKSRVVFVTDSEKLVGAFEQVLGVRVRYLPHIISYDFSAQPHGAKDAAPTGQNRILPETQGGAVACPGLLDGAPLGLKPGDASPKVAITGSALGNFVWSSAFRRCFFGCRPTRQPPKGGTPNPEALRLTDVKLAEMRPQPGDATLLVTESSHLPERPIVIFVGGNARREKGFVEIVQAVRAVQRSEAAGRYRFVIQCHDPDPTCADVLRSASADEGIDWIARPLDNDEYITRIRGADVLLVPYHLDCYELRTSGVFCEARVAGKPVIASKGSWAGDRIHREGGGWLVGEKDAAGLEAALRSLPDGLAKIAAEAEALAPQAKREFSRDGFFHGLVELYSEVTDHVR